MIDIEDISEAEMKAFLASHDFGHLGMSRGDQPYLVPMHYAYDGEWLYFFTTLGTKTECLDQNHRVCFQVEEIQDREHWQSVMVSGEAEHITDATELEKATQLITARNPALTPAINLTRIDAWGRANDVALYRIRPRMIDGRRTQRSPPV
jgi:nitroimidazol reductase NimA-like FMN-containing flavoprotein (pyridoxamine 5'-phosphate oxidase superfamily)